MQSEDLLFKICDQYQAQGPRMRLPATAVQLLWYQHFCVPSCPSVGVHRGTLLFGGGGTGGVLWRRGKRQLLGESRRGVTQVKWKLSSWKFWLIIYYFFT